MSSWLPTLESLLETTALNSHPSYRVFITGEPAPSPEQHVIPAGILENAVKITNEPPNGMNASLHAALNNFSQVGKNSSSKYTSIKIISIYCVHLLHFYRTLWRCAPENRSSTPCSSLSAFSMLVSRSAVSLVPKAGTTFTPSAQATSPSQLMSCTTT